MIKIRSRKHKYINLNKDCPPKGVFCIYTIFIGNKLYIGYSHDLKRRLGVHASYLNNIMYKRFWYKKYHKNSVYRNFLHEDLVKYGYKFAVIKICTELEEALELENILLNTTPNTLNINKAKKYAKTFERKYNTK